MAQFQFRFQILLKFREAERQQRRFALAQAREADQLLQQQLDALAAEVVDAKEACRRAAAPGEVDVDRLLELRRYILTLRAKSQGVSHKQRQVREEVERRRVMLVEADRLVRMLDKLREKQEQAFAAELEKLERKSADEVAGSLKHWRKGGAECARRP